MLTIIYDALHNKLLPLNLTPINFCHFFLYQHPHHRDVHSFPTRRSSDLPSRPRRLAHRALRRPALDEPRRMARSEEHTSELQSPCNIVCRLLLEKKKKKNIKTCRSKITSTCRAV